MSIIDKWVEIVPEKYGSRKKAIEKFNMICNKKIRESELSAFKSGKRRTPDCILWLMLNDIIIDVLEEAGWKNAVMELPSDKMIDLLNNLTPPKKWEQ